MFLSTDASGQFLLTAYYVEAQVTVHRIDAGRIVEPPLQTVPTDDRAHGVLTDRENRFAFVPHTGPNKIFQFRFDSTNGRLSASEPTFIQTGDQTGPRHLALHPAFDVVYVDYEQGSAIAAFDLDRTTGQLKFRERLSSVPEGYKKPNSNARLEMTPNGRFIYVANRGHDSLAGFAIDPRDGRLTSLGQTPTPATPRGFGISPAGRFLYAAGQSADELVAFAIDGDSGSLNRIATHETGSRPWWVLVTQTIE